MNFLSSPHSRGLVAPKRCHKGGFTLVEIMIVVAIVGILSALAVVAVHRIKLRAEQAIVLNTLRRIYSAKEMYFTAEPSKTEVFFPNLATSGYTSNSLRAAVEHPPGNWHYLLMFQPNKPVVATERTASGSVSAGNYHQTTTQSIYYPARER